MESSAACPLHEILEMVRPLSDPYGSASVGTVVLELLSAFDGEGRVEFFKFRNQSLEVSHDARGSGIFVVVMMGGCVQPCAFMRGRSTSRTVIPIDLEIEATWCNNAARRQREQDIDTSPPPSPNHVQMDEGPARRVTLEDFSHTTTPEFFTSIARPEVQAPNISYPHSLIQLIQGNLFHGLPSEDPYTHLASFIEICNMVKIARVLAEAVRLNLFSFSLAGEAKRWLHSFKGNTFRTWKKVVEKFLKKYFPESKTAEGKMEISSFHQFPDESLSEALDPITRRIRGRKDQVKTPEEAMELIENMAASDQAILRDRSYVPTKRSLLELSTQDATLAQNKLLSRQIEALTETLNKLPQQLQAVNTSHSYVLQVEDVPHVEGHMSLDNAQSNKSSLKK
ncbi:hypothetical protein HKD37_20G055336 [Glycine soja]